MAARRLAPWRWAPVQQQAGGSASGPRRLGGCRLGLMGPGIRHKSGCRRPGTSSAGSPEGASCLMVVAGPHGTSICTGGHRYKENNGRWITTADRMQIAIKRYEIDRTAPRVSFVERQTPAVERTNANSLTWRVTFSDEVQNVDTGDSTVSGTDAPVTVITVSVSKTAYDEMVSGGDLASLNGSVALSLARGQDIQDMAGHDMVNTRPRGTNQSTYVVENRGPQLASATVNGTKLTLAYDERLDTSGTNPEPPSSAFAVRVAGSARTLATSEQGKEGKLK